METDAKMMMLYDAKKKSVIVAYLLYFILGFWFQTHRFYAGKRGFALFFLFCPVVGLFFFNQQPMLGSFFLTIWAFVGIFDIFYMPFMVKKTNIRIIEQLVRGH